MPQTQERYDSTSIVVLEGLEGVRRRPGMYIGDDQSRGFHHLLWEILDNAVDEALAGYCTQIDVTLWGDRAEVRDDGRGIPVDVHVQTGKSALETIFTTLHAGGKFGNSAYRVSGGLHGVGSSVVNALSEWLEVEMRRDGKHCCQVFRRGIPDGSLRPVRRVSDWTPKTGTLVRFRPDPEIFRCEKDREGKLPASDPLIRPRFTSP